MKTLPIYNLMTDKILSVICDERLQISHPATPLSFNILWVMRNQHHQILLQKKT